MILGDLISDDGKSATGVAYRTGKNQSVNEKLPRLPAKNVYNSFCHPTTLAKSYVLKRASHLQRILPREDGYQWHISNGHKGSDHPSLKIQALEPILVFRG